MGLWKIQVQCKFLFIAFFFSKQKFVIKIYIYKILFTEHLLYARNCVLHFPFSYFPQISVRWVHFLSFFN